MTETKNNTMETKERKKAPPPPAPGEAAKQAAGDKPAGGAAKPAQPQGADQGSSGAPPSPPSPPPGKQGGQTTAQDKAAGAAGKKTARAATPPPVERPAAKREQRAGGNGLAVGLAVLALLLAAAVAGGLYWGWQQLQATQAALTDVAGESRAEAQSVAQSAADQMRQELAEVTGRMGSLDQQLGQLSQGQQAVRGELESLYNRLGQRQVGWMLAEAEYLMRVANHRVNLSRDIETAVTALQTADRRLKRVNDPALTPVREAIAAEISALEAVEEPDITGMAARLSGLSRQVDNLPLLAAKRPQAAPGPEPVETEAPLTEWEGWKQLFAAVWDSLKGLVTVRYNEKPVAALLPPEQAEFLLQNLRAKLEQARLALLQRNTAVYSESLATAQAWISEYFDTQSQATQSMVGALAELEQTALAPPLPDISDSLRQLEAVAGEIAAREAGGEGAS